MQIEQWPLDRLLPSPRNTRAHTEGQIAEIAGSIKAFGFTNPILVNEAGDVVAGHGRLAAARKLALDRVPVISLKHLNELQCRQLMPADNRIALNSGWDVEALKLGLADLSQLGSDLRSLGLSKNELAAALRGASSGNTDEDETPALTAKAVSQAGDVWILGKHRLICGDCTDRDLVARVLEDSKPQLLSNNEHVGISTKTADDLLKFLLLDCAAISSVRCKTFIALDLDRLLPGFAKQASNTISCAKPRLVTPPIETGQF